MDDDARASPLSSLTSKPLMLKSRFGLSLEYTLTKESSHSMVVTERGSRFLMSQNVARPRLTSCCDPGGVPQTERRKGVTKREETAGSKKKHAPTCP